MFWPFKKFIAVAEKTDPGIYVERVETIWVNPAFADSYDPEPAIQKLVNSYWPASVHRSRWPLSYIFRSFWHLKSWAFSIWNEYDDWKEERWAHGMRICGLEFEFH